MFTGSTRGGRGGLRLNRSGALVQRVRGYGDGRHRGRDVVEVENRSKRQQAEPLGVHGDPIVEVVLGKMTGQLENGDVVKSLIVVVVVVVVVVIVARLGVKLVFFVHKIVLGPMQVHG